MKKPVRNAPLGNAGKDNQGALWWQPGLVLFARLSSWIIGPIIIAVIIGKYLDKIFHSAPWLFSISVLSAFIFSIIKIVRIGLKEMDNK